MKGFLQVLFSFCEICRKLWTTMKIFHQIAEAELVLVAYFVIFRVFKVFWDL